MNTGLRFLQGSTALLYFGPLLAGLGGFGWAVVYVFAAIFLGWLFILRPQHWPRRLADWGRPEALISVLTQVAVQLLLVAVSFGIGRGIGGVLGSVPSFPLMLPVAISFLSIPLARMIWDPWKADQMNVLLDDALAGVSAGQAKATQTEAFETRVSIAERLVWEMGKLPEQTPPEVLSEHLMAISAQVGHDALRMALMDRVYDGSASPLIRRATVVHATTAQVAEQLGGATYPLAIFLELKSAEVLELFARRGLALVEDLPAVARDLPAVAQVQGAARLVPEAGPRLMALADRLGALQADGAAAPAAGQRPAGSR